MSQLCCDACKVISPGLERAGYQNVTYIIPFFVFLSRVLLQEQNFELAERLTPSLYHLITLPYNETTHVFFVYTYIFV